MATPGRTHIPWETQTGQVQELISYICYLEAKIQYLQFHHDTCHNWSVTLLPGFDEFLYLPPEFIVTNDPALSSAQATTLTESPVIDLTVKRAHKVPASNARWRQIIDKLTTGWDEPNSWANRRADIGLKSVERNHIALTILLELKSAESEGQETEAMTGIMPGLQPNEMVTGKLVTVARQYALGTKSFERHNGFAVQLHSFRELVLVSLCVVIEHEGIPIETINDLMRICLSSSGAANLYRLRRGALWVNRVIAGLIRKGWQHGATEFFLLSGRPISQYGLLWEACVHSFPCLSERLDYIYKTVEIPAPDSRWISFSIPLMIKELVGDALTLEQVRIALDYDDT
ncbi:hypothetical protein VTL71DRAFT_2937 [Oculimacula yallundae]|uniref:Uncharacterized protein n=1 Tax=Oculimacula yallundae TaxID=86028 RepID=A0ABR4C5Q5_9HELO